MKILFKILIFLCFFHPHPSEAQNHWPYDPSLQPISLQEMERIIRSPKATTVNHQRLLSRAGASHLLEYAVSEYNQARKVRPEDPVLQSAFGFAYFIQRDNLYKPSNKPLRDKEREELFGDAMDALDAGVRGKGANIAFCWRALAYKSLGQHSGYFADGVENAKKALAVDPNDPSCYIQMAFAYSVWNKFRNPDKVLVLARKAAKL